MSLKLRQSLIFPLYLTRRASAVICLHFLPANDDFQPNSRSANLDEG